MPRVARIGDAGSHGGVIVTGRPSATAEGRLIATVGDIYDCPIHGRNPIKSGSTIASIEGRDVARVGDPTDCGAVITTGSPSRSDEG